MIRLRRPVVVLGVLLVAAAVVELWFPNAAMVILSASLVVLALGWSGRAAWVAGLGGLAAVLLFSVLTDVDSPVAAVMFTVPPFVVGTVLRLRNETADQLARRACELEEERELFTEIAVRHERARIAGELHDVVGHAVSVMVIQAAAGQRLVDTDPGRARAAFAAISESARQGTQDLDRLVALLGGTDLGAGGLSDLFLVDEVVDRACHHGLNVTCRFEGDRERVSLPVAHLVFRVVQESLTNALRHAPGAYVRVVIRVEEADQAVAVEVENDCPVRDGASINGTGLGLVGLRERVRTLGGTFAAGATGAGGWAVEARLPLAP